MKKVISLVLCCIISFACFSINVFAASNVSESPAPAIEVYEDEDGGVLTIRTYVYSTYSNSRAGASKEYTYSVLGSKKWQYILFASFDSDDTATEALDSYRIYDSSWDLDYSDTSVSGNTAYGDATFSTSSKSKDVNITLTCVNGNIK